MKGRPAGAGPSLLGAPECSTWNIWGRARMAGLCHVEHFEAGGNGRNVPRGTLFRIYAILRGGARHQCTEFRANSLQRKLAPLRGVRPLRGLARASRGSRRSWRQVAAGRGMCFPGSQERGPGAPHRWWENARFNPEIGAIRRGVRPLRGFARASRGSRRLRCQAVAGRGLCFPGSRNRGPGAPHHWWENSRFNPENWATRLLSGLASQITSMT